jgi:hypothetical protein
MQELTNADGDAMNCYFCDTPFDSRGACPGEMCDYKGIVPCPGCGTVQVWHHGYSCDKREEFYRANPQLLLPEV